MSRYRRIKRTNLPSHFPVTGSMTMYLFMDHFNAPEWLWGVVGFVTIVAWCAAAYSIIVTDEVDVVGAKQ